MHVLIAGASGFVGQALMPYLTAKGHVVTRLGRSEKNTPDGIHWDPSRGVLEAQGLEGMDTVVNLAGESILAKRWNPDRKREILESRVKSTRLLCEKISMLERPPKVLISASAIGYYGDRGNERLDENSAKGTGFLAEVAAAWEAATEPAVRKGIRVVCLRIGIVLSPRGGALAQMLPIFKAGLGGRLGSGRQFMSWVTLDDLLKIILYAIQAEKAKGPVNATAPNPVMNGEFTRALAKALRRSAIVPVPILGLRLLFGEMADETLLASTRALPQRLIDSGYVFDHAELEGALASLLT